MSIGILGKKLGMTQLFQEDGTWIPVTVIQAGPCKVLQVKTKDSGELAEDDRNAATNLGKKRGKVQRPRRSDGYYAVQMGFDDKLKKAANKAETGHASKAKAEVQIFVREFRWAEKPPYSQGDEIKLDILKDVKFVDVTGTSKGKGFAGTIKRYNFARQSTTHGNSKSHRRMGGIGRQYSTAKGVTKGKKMPGHMGVERSTVQSLQVVKIDEERNLLYVRGAVPGYRSGYLMVHKASKK